MKIILSGYNVDRETLMDSSLTPETICAAYARISRSEKDISDLRSEARNDIEKSRKSNETIVFGLGHSSIAEHAVFNFDLMEISRIAIEYIQSHRLASYTEKSQRYVSVKSGYHIPEEIKSDKLLLKSYKEFCDICFELYFKAQKLLSSNDLTLTETNEDARYMLPLSTYTQCGLTINGRSLEYLISDLRSQDSFELRNIGEMLFSQIKNVAPSIIKYTEGRKVFKKVIPKVKYKFPKKILQIISFDKRGQDKIIMTLKFKNEGIKYKRQFKAEKFDLQNLENIVFSLNDYDKVPREFEMSGITFIAYCSASCFAQLKRHRMSTIIPQAYSFTEKPFIPHTFIKTELKTDLEKLSKKALLIDRKIRIKNENFLPYSALNATKRAVLVKMNSRELYHFVRLRSDKHAQLEIRKISDTLAEESKKISPSLYKYLCGKDTFKSIK